MKYMFVVALLFAMVEIMVVAFLLLENSLKWNIVLFRLISKTSLCSTEKEVKEISPNELLYFPYFQVHKTASKENYM